MSSIRSGAHLLVESLVSQGGRILFGIPGVGTLSIYDAFVDHPELRHIEVRHEQSAIFMADGLARATGDPGIALTSNGPGALNTLAAMATAHNDSVPVLHLVSENPPEVRRRGRGYFHDISDQMGIFRPVSGHTATVAHADEIPSAIETAYNAMRSRRPRTALVEFNNEALTSMADSAPARPTQRRLRPIDPSRVAEAAALLTRAARPIVWAGGGVATTAAAAALVRLVERLGAPVITTQKGKGAVPSGHPLHLGNWANEPPVRRLIADCDLLIAVGTRFSYFPTGGWSLRLPDTIVQIDVDPTELGHNYPIEVGIEGDVEVAVEALSGQLDMLGHEPAPWRADEVAAVMAEVAAAIGSRPEIDTLMRLREALPPETLVFNDPTTIAFWARSLWKTDRPRTWFIPSGFGTLGFALPAAIGAKLARPDTPTVAIVGDAGVMFTVQDLMTAVEHHVPVIVLVFNDRGYGVERRHQDHLYGRRSGVDLLPPDFVALAHAFGATGIRLDDHTLIGDTVARHLNADGPVLIEVPGALEHPGYGAFGRYGNLT